MNEETIRRWREWDRQRRSGSLDEPTITKDPEKLPKISAAFLASGRRALRRDAEIFQRAAEGSAVARAVIGLTMSRAKFTRN